jgi:hypothetical protein
MWGVVPNSLIHCITRTSELCMMYSGFHNNWQQRKILPNLANILNQDNDVLHSSKKIVLSLCTRDPIKWLPCSFNETPNWLACEIIRKETWHIFPWALVYCLSTQTYSFVVILVLSFRPEPFFALWHHSQVLPLSRSWWKIKRRRIIYREFHLKSNNKTCQRSALNLTFPDQWATFCYLSKLEGIHQHSS